MRENDIRTVPDESHFNFKGFEWIALDNNVDGGVLAVMTSSWNGKDALLLDILETEVPQKYFLSKEQTEKIVFK